MYQRPYALLLEYFQAGVLDADTRGVDAVFRAPPNVSTAERFAIYIRAYRQNLFNAVADDFTALEHYLGAASFSALLNDYISRTQSRHFNLERYGMAFPQHMRTYCDDAFAVALSELEGAIHRVHSMDESVPLDPAWFEGIDPNALGGMRFYPRTAMELLALPYPADQYLTHFRETGIAAPPSPESSFIAVYRHGNIVRREIMAQSEFMLLQLLAQGKTLSDAIDALLEAEPESGEHLALGLQEWFRHWLSVGMLRAAPEQMSAQ